MDEEEEGLVAIPSLAVDRDIVASGLLELAADHHTALSKFFLAMSFAYAAQVNKNIDDRLFHEEIARDIEGITAPTEE